MSSVNNVVDNEINDVVEDSDSDEKYQKEYWIYTNILLQYCPYVFTMIIGIFIKNFQFKSLLENGDLIITAFAISSMTVFELFGCPANNNKRKRLRYFVSCILIAFVEIVVYAGIKIEDKDITLIIGLSLLLNIATIVFSIAANFYIIDVKRLLEKSENNKEE